ncbi:MAG: hypothetical protein RMK52_03610 [Chitinophagales bacterium]|nr:hypothetical protein [Chitinophagales bacterium]MDW8393314.1 hypothetical protein [Chitinophagales bacterium]
MNTQVFNASAALVSGLLLFASCKKEIIEKQQYGQVVYEVNSTTLYQSNLEKTRLKSSEQFVSILYSDLFNETPSIKYLNDLTELFLSFGDKRLLQQLYLENLLQDPQLTLPSNAEMRSDIPAFVTDTYLRFYQRMPSEYEKYYFTQLISNDTTITPEQVYAAFIQSNEYQYY